jgi:hypothetical protein
VSSDADTKKVTDLSGLANSWCRTAGFGVSGILVRRTTIRTMTAAGRMISKRELYREQTGEKFVNEIHYHLQQ